jgi:RNA polymerase sigma-70 factor (ECF subfamily)
LNRNIAYNNLDKTLFEQLFKENFNSLCLFARGFVHDKDIAGDIVQEVFINLWNKKETITSDKSVRAYLYTSVKNRCLNHIRDHAKFRSYFLDVEIEEEKPVTQPDQFEKEEFQIKIDNAMNKLPEKCRQVFEMSRYEELKYGEIAEKLEISVKTVEAQITKALKILREELKDLMWVILLILNLN